MSREDEFRMRAASFYKQLRAVNEWLPPPDRVAADSLNLEWQGQGTMPMLTLAVRIDMPDRWAE